MILIIKGIFADGHLIRYEAWKWKTQFYFSKQFCYMFVCMFNRLVMSYSSLPCGLQPTRFLCPWNFPGKNTAMGCHFLFRESSWPMGQTRISCVSCTDRWSLYTWEVTCLLSFKYNSFYDIYVFLLLNHGLWIIQITIHISNLVEFSHYSNH